MDLDCSVISLVIQQLCIKMKKFIFGLFMCSILISFASGYTNDEAWNDYKVTHGKAYTSLFGGGWRDRMRKEIFLVQHANIKQHNSGDSPSYRKELNKFSDMLPSEWSKYLGLRGFTAPTTRLNESTKVDLESRQIPATLDYRYDSCMPAIKDQGQCGSCWAFSAVNPLEFAQCKKYSAPVILSEQQLVDCDKLDWGCNGGDYMTAWKYMKKKGGSAQRSLYSPYNARRNICRFRTSMVGAKVSSFSHVSPNNDASAMQVALQTYGPLSVAFAVIDSFVPYASGVYDDPKCDNVNLNHAVVAVGWGNLNGVDYWIVRNSWGSGWGLSGYVLIQRGVNKCGIESSAAYVVPV